MKLIELEDGVLINPELVTYIRETEDRKSFHRDHRGYLQYLLAIKAAGDDLHELADLNERTPPESRSKPKIEDYVKTMISLADGECFYVKAELKAVKWALTNGVPISFRAAHEV